MTQAASQAAAFYREVAETGELWLLEDDEGQVPIVRAGQGEDEHEVTPALSSERRARKGLEALPGGYDGLTPARYEWTEFCGGLAKTLEQEGVRLGVNWTGKSMTGYDVSVEDVEEAVRRGTVSP